ncbi:(2Fe-2S) ferredoxin domain-containing protein [Capilliphycus salinus ALCB114379]|uniref:(2Fe-2S) ferredoxin domain-containing protein n=1 Tax=Capilliphycus salinus TaxID=2768948 RepID=UPI0039A5D45B
MPETQVNNLSSNPAEAIPRVVRVCQNQSCLRHGSQKVLKAFEEAEISGAAIEASGCMGQCSVGPTVKVTPDEIWYYRVQPEDVPRIIEQHLEGGEPVQEKLNPRIHRRFYY